MAEILERLGEKNPERRARFALTLVRGAPGDEGKIRELIGALGEVEKSNKYVRWVIIDALKECGPDAVAALPLLVEAAKDQDLTVAKEAINAIGALRDGASPAIPALIELLENSDPRLRKRSAIALGSIGAKSLPAVPALIKRLDDDDAGVVEMSLSALRQIGHPAVQALPHIEHLSVDPKHAALHRIAADTLRSIRADENGSVLGSGAHRNGKRTR